MADFAIGGRGVQTFRPMHDRLVEAGVTSFRTDKWSVYQKVIRAKHLIGKEYTERVEAFWSDMRLFVKSMNRKTKCIAKSLRGLYENVVIYNAAYNLRKMGELQG